jgi:hypothetical protein
LSCGCEQTEHHACLCEQAIFGASNHINHPCWGFLPNLCPDETKCPACNLLKCPAVYHMYGYCAGSMTCARYCDCVRLSECQTDDIEILFGDGIIPELYLWNPVTEMLILPAYSVMYMGGWVLCVTESHPEAP